MDIEKAKGTCKAYINAIDTFGTIDYKCINNLYEPIDAVLSELEKKDTEIIEAKEANRQLSLELEKKEAIINEMAKHIHLSGDYECLNKECEDDGDISCEDCIKEYFYKKVKETKDNGSTRNF